VLEVPRQDALACELIETGEEAGGLVEDISST